MSRVLCVVVAIAAVASVARIAPARAAAAHDNHLRATEVGEHGLKVGDVVPHVAMACQESPSEIAGSGHVQLITFSTPQDCSACSEHLAGLETLAVHHELPEHAIVALWAPGTDLEREVAHLRGRTHRNLCLDRAGELWDRLDISHTPFTVLVRNDTIVYINDSPLTQTSKSADFVHDVNLLSREH